MRIPHGFMLAAAAVGILITLIVGRLLISPPLPLIMEAGFDRESISPNADGVNDLAVFAYRLARPAVIDITLTAADGQTFSFREQQTRADGEYSVLFSGVVDGYRLDGEQAPGHIERRLMPNGAYDWRLHARAESGETMTANGALRVEDGDSPLPIMSIFSVSPTVFSPNQDGIADRVDINVYLEKDVDSLDVFLVGPDGARIPISARVEERRYGQAGRHRYDYEGGIDLGADPPPDGPYQVVALAQDAVGQRIRQQASLTIENGGKPYAEIAPQTPGVDIAWDVMPYSQAFFASRGQAGALIPPPDDVQALAYSQQIAAPLGDMLVFRLTVENYGDVPIRTTGPPPGTVYQQEQNAAALGWLDESGAWRLGVQCAASLASYPYRWAIGSDKNLLAVYDETTGHTYRYLPAGASAVVWGAVRLTTVEARNPQNCWAGLIHEDVAISLRNNHVGMRSIMIVDPNAEA